MQCKTEGCENEARPRSPSGKGIAPSYCNTCRPHAGYVPRTQKRASTTEYHEPLNLPDGDTQKRQSRELERAQLELEYSMQHGKLATAVYLHAVAVMRQDFSKAHTLRGIIAHRTATLLVVTGQLAKVSDREA
jgi:hypothetical protein